MKWIPLETKEQLDELVKASIGQPQVIFKYSSTCSLSETMRLKLESATPANAVFHFLDLLRFRSLSNLVADKFHVRHESPQVLLIRNGECVYEEDHFRINMEEIQAEATR